MPAPRVEKPAREGVYSDLIPMQSAVVGPPLDVELEVLPAPGCLDHLQDPFTDDEQPTTVGEESLAEGGPVGESTPAGQGAQDT